MGTQDGTSERLAPEDEQLFPHLTPENYRVTSPCDALYNVVYLMRRPVDERV